MPDSSADRDPLDRLAEEFVARYRAGQRPALTEYADRHPDLAADIRDLFPALVEMEQLKPVTADATGDFTPNARPSDPTRVGEFRILRRVGVGGMGVVYEALQESLGRHVALKLLPIDALADPKRLERFRREAKAAARLHHTNIVPVFGTGEADGRHFYAMQFIAGHPLDAVVDEVRHLKDQTAAPATRAASEVAAALVTGTFAPPASATDDAPAPAVAGSSPTFSGSLSDGGRHYWATVARLGAQAADALAYAHAQGILHRDIKPANLLLDLRGTLWVTDFGLAKATDADDLTHAGDFVGTLRYMAPERFDGGGDGRADTYALGLTLYELLTLTPAFQADTRAKLVEQVIAASPKPPRAVNPAVPRDLETIVLKAIARDPAGRYQSAAALADDLRRFTEDRPIHARRASSAEQAWRWCRRNPAVASLLAAVLVVFAAGAGVSWAFARDAERKEHDARTEANRADGERDRANAKAIELEAEQGKLRAEQDNTRRTLYVMQINQAQAALAGSRPLRAVELLRDAAPKAGEPDLRDWEWNYLARQMTPDRFVDLNAAVTAAAPADADGPHQTYRAHQISEDGSRAFFWREAEAGYYCSVVDTATARPVGRIPKAGYLPNKPDPRGSIMVPTATLSPDGRHALVGQAIVLPPQPDVRGRRFAYDPALWRLTAVDTGEDIPLPPDLVREFDSKARLIAVGPGAAWLTLVGWKLDKLTEEFGGLPTVLASRPAEVVCTRWDRATNKTPEVLRFTIGKGYGHPAVTPDGRSVYWAASFRPAFYGANERPRPEPSWFECWDVSGAEPKQRGKPFQLEGTGDTSPGNVRDVSPPLAFSPDGSKVAYPNAAGEVVVHRVADGEFHARISVPDLPRNIVSSVRGSAVVRVNDAGDRVVVRLPSAIVVAEKTAGGVASWRRPVPAWSASAYMDDAGPGGFRLLPDGKTFVEFTGSTRHLRIWDVSRDPSGYAPIPRATVAAERDGKAVWRQKTPDGRLSLEWPVGDGSQPVTTTSGTVVPLYRGGPIVVRDAAGKEVGRLSGPANSVILVAPLDGGRRLFVRFSVRQSGGTAQAGTNSLVRVTCDLYDLTAGVRRVETDIGNIPALATWSAAVHLVEEPWFDGIRPLGDAPTAEFVNIRDGRTGEKRFTVAVPGRLVRFCGFDPTGRTYLVESIDRLADQEIVRVSNRGRIAASAVGGGIVQALDRGLFGRPFAPQTTVRRTFRIHLRDAVTHKDRWTWDAPELFAGLVSDAQFSPDGRRVLFRYDAYREKPPAGQQTFPSRPQPIADHLWVARADGTVERDEVLRTYDLDRSGGRVRNNFTLPQSYVVCSPDGRHAAVTGDQEVVVWDLDAGVLRHRLTGHTGFDRNGIGVTYSADGRRLFTIDGANVGFGRTTPGKPQVHVWDTVGGRELLTLDVGGNVQGVLWAEFAAGKLTLRSQNRERVLDGTPVNP